MSLEEFSSIESYEGGGQSVEVLEKFKESIKKNSTGLKRTKKDETKAKKYDILLAGFLVKIIIDKRYDSLLEYLFRCSRFSYPSNFLLGIFSLINISISNEIRKISNKPKINYDFKSKEEMAFDDDNLPLEVKNRINYWIEDIVDVVSIEYSSITTKNLLKLLKEKELILDFISGVFMFFLKESNISIKSKISLNISDFILDQVKLEIKKIKLEEF